MSEGPKKVIEESFVDWGAQRSHHVLILVHGLVKCTQHLQALVLDSQLRVVNYQGLSQVLFDVLFDSKEQLLDAMDHLLDLVLSAVVEHSRLSKRVLDPLNLLHGHYHVLLSS